MLPYRARLELLDTLWPPKAVLDQDEVYSLRFSGLDDVFGPDNGCFTNWAFRNFYNKKTEEIVYWDIGQDIIFLKGDDFSSGYDNEISDSLKFLN